MRLEGIYAPLPTPFTDGGELAIERLRENVERLNGTGLAGFLALGSNGEAVHQTDEEAGRVYACVRAAAAPGMTVLAGTGRGSTRATVELTRRAAAAGCDAALVVTPSYYRGSMTPRALRTFYEAVADASPIPVLLYNVPASTNLNLPLETAAELSRHPNVAGIKDSAGDVSQLAELLRRTRGEDFHVASGAFGSALPATAFGLRAAIVAIANIAPGLCADVLRLALDGDREKAGELYLRLLPAARAVTSGWGVPGIKAALDLVGAYGGPPRGPLLPLEDAPRRELQSILRDAGLL